MMFSPTVMELNSAPPWNATPMLLRNSIIWRVSVEPKSRPLSRMEPDVGTSRAIR